MKSKSRKRTNTISPLQIEFRNTHPTEAAEARIRHELVFPCQPVSEVNYEVSKEGRTPNEYRGALLHQLASLSGSDFRFFPPLLPNQGRKVT